MGKFEQHGYFVDPTQVPVEVFESNGEFRQATLYGVMVSTMTDQEHYFDDKEISVKFFLEGYLNATV